MITDSEILRRHQRGLSFRIVPPTDWRATLRTRANVLVTGPKDALAAFLKTARSEMREPIRSSGAAPLPSLEGARTLILTDVDALDGADQQRLRRWFDERDNADVQVVTLTTVPLFSLVTANAFDAQLYYRLNTIFLEIQPA
jgi:transcriptional regulator of acetoin/glycerol metabolism